MNPISVIIADDHKLLREAMQVVLSTHPHCKVVAEAANAEEAVALARQHRPQLVIMDINMPGMDGIEATTLIRKYAPGTKVIGVTSFSQPAYARKMMQKGAMGYVTKGSPKAELFEAIAAVAAGRKYLCQSVKNALAQMIFNEDSNRGINSLTSREIEVAEKVKLGFSTREIAEQLHLSVKTVEVHRYNLLKKLNLKNATALANFAHFHLS